MRVTEVYAATSDAAGRRAMARWLKNRQGRPDGPVKVAELIPPDAEEATPSDAWADNAKTQAEDAQPAADAAETAAPAPEEEASDNAASPQEKGGLPAELPPRGSISDGMWIGERRARRRPVAGDRQRLQKGASRLAADDDKPALNLDC